MFDLFVGHESIHNIFKWNRINGDGTEQNEWNGMNKIKYTRLNDNVTEYIERKRISSVSWSIFLCVCVCVLTMLTMCLWECWVKWKIFSLMWTNLKATDLYSGLMRSSEMRAMPYLSIYLYIYERERESSK